MAISFEAAKNGVQPAGRHEMSAPSDTTGIHVLLVDDDIRLQANTKDFLEPYGCSVSSVSDGREIDRDIARLQPDIVLLDVMLPGEDGFTVLKNLRAASRIPVIMLTARGNDTDRIVGLELGADDYLPKPFNPRELLARIKAVLRRMTPDAGGGPEVMSGSMDVGPIHLDCKMQRISSGGASIDLTITEFRIIRVFMGRPGRILSRDEIQTLAFGENYSCNDRNIDVYISRVRSTLRKLCGESCIRTVWGSGYCWVADEPL
jgi:two-component system phosphate regulon response regulator OmpR